MPTTVPTPDDVFQGVKARVATDPAYATNLPGGLWMDRRPAGKGYPYAVGTVEEQPPAELSNGTYTQKFVVELTVWVASADSAAADTATARRWLAGLVGRIVADAANGVSVPNCVRTLHVRPAGGKLKTDPDLKRGQDVLAGGHRVEVLIQGLRG